MAFIHTHCCVAETKREKKVHERDCFCGFEVLRIWSEHEIIKHSYTEKTKQKQSKIK